MYPAKISDIVAGFLFCNKSFYFGVLHDCTDVRLAAPRVLVVGGQTDV